MISESETGELVKFNAHKRFPVISLPEIVTNPIFTIKRRFNTSTTTAGTITIADLLKQFVVATSATTGVAYVTALRLKKICALAPITTQGTSTTLIMRPQSADGSNNCFNAVPETYLDTSSSIDVPSYINLTPSIKTPLGSWHYASNVSANLLDVSFPAGTCVDMTIEFILRCAESAVSGYSRVLVGATTGVMYAGSILTNITPVGVNYQ